MPLVSAPVERGRKRGKSFGGLPLVYNMSGVTGPFIVPVIAPSQKISLPFAFSSHLASEGIFKTPVALGKRCSQTWREGGGQTIIDLIDE